MKKKLFEFLPLFLFAVIGLLFYQAPTVERSAPSLPTSGFGNAYIERVVDGDTVVAVLDGTAEKVKIRLLGVNTPETVDPRRPVQCFGKEASAFAKKLLNNKRVLLKGDLEADEQDKYGRLLRYIFIENDETSINALLIREGYGFAYTSFPMNKKKKAEFLALERGARESERGLWNPDTCSSRKH